MYREKWPHVHKRVASLQGKWWAKLTLNYLLKVIVHMKKKNTRDCREENNWRISSVIFDCYRLVRQATDMLLIGPSNDVSIRELILWLFWEYSRPNVWKFLGSWILWKLTYHSQMHNSLCLTQPYNTMFNQVSLTRYIFPSPPACSIGLNPYT